MQEFTRALVTGASSGIGLAMARQLADQGVALVVVARDEERLRALADELAVDCEVLVADLGELEAIGRVADRIEAADDPVDLVINNAGFGVTGPVTEQTPAALRSMIDVNVSALVHLSQVAAGAMQTREHGQILNVSSAAAWLVAPGSSVYAATKAFVTSFSQSLRVELEGSGVGVSCLCPGLTRTEFQDRADFDTSDLPDLLWQTAEAVAKAGLAAAAANKAVEIPGALNKAAIGGTRFLPLAAIRKLGALTAER